MREWKREILDEGREWAWGDGRRSRGRWTGERMTGGAVARPQEKNQGARGIDQRGLGRGRWQKWREATPRQPNGNGQWLNGWARWNGRNRLTSSRNRTVADNERRDRVSATRNEGWSPRCDTCWIAVSPVRWNAIGFRLMSLAESMSKDGDPRWEAADGEGGKLRVGLPRAMCRLEKRKTPYLRTVSQ